MIKWIKNLFVSKRLRAANKRILELETEVSALRQKVTDLEDTFIPDVPDEERYAAHMAQLFVHKINESIQKAFRLLKLIFNKSKSA